MTRAFIAVGSDIAPATNVPAALARLRERFDVRTVSPIYESEPVGTARGAPFWNAVVEVAAAGDPIDIKGTLRRIEADLGRVRTDDRFASRTIDLDLVLYGDVVDPGFPLPDPDIRRYPFVAVPLLDVAPELVLPEDGAPLRAVVAGMDSVGLRALES